MELGTRGGRGRGMRKRKRKRKRGRGNGEEQFLIENIKRRKSKMRKMKKNSFISNCILKI